MKSYRFRTISVALVLVLAFSFVLSACAPAPAPAPAAPAEQPEATTAPAAQEEPTVAPPAEMQKVVWVSPRGTLEVMDDFNMWVADKMGYFKDLGVEVEMQPGPLEALAVTITGCRSMKSFCSLRRERKKPASASFSTHSSPPPHG